MRVELAGPGLAFQAPAIGLNFQNKEIAAAVRECLRSAVSAIEEEHQAVAAFRQEIGHTEVVDSLALHSEAAAVVQVFDVVVEFEI